MAKIIPDNSVIEIFIEISQFYFECCNMSVGRQRKLVTIVTLKVKLKIIYNIIIRVVSCKQ